MFFQMSSGGCITIVPTFHIFDLCYSVQPAREETVPAERLSEETDNKEQYAGPFETTKLMIVLLNALVLSVQAKT